MPGELATKVRLVRCPKCRLLLPELPHYNVYKCGGCDTTLQAKRRKSEAVNSESSSLESQTAPRNTLDLVSENTSSKKEQLVFPQETVERKETTKSLSGARSLNKSSKKGQNENDPKGNDQGTKATSSSSGECSLVEYGGRDHNEHGECNGQQLETSKLSDENLKNKMDTANCSGSIINQHELSNKCRSTLFQCEVEANDTNLLLAESEKSNNGSLLLEGAKEELSSAANGENIKNDKSAPAGAKSAVDITGSDSTSRCSSTNNIAPEKGSNSLFTSRISKDDTASDNEVLSHGEQLKQAENSINLSFVRVRSMDTQLINLSSELSDTLGELSNSPATRSSHVYDGSISSYDGMDEQIRYDQHLNPSHNTRSVADAVSAERWAKDLADSMIYSESKARQQFMKFSSDFPNGKHPVMEVEERAQFPSKIPFNCSGSQSGYDSGGLSNQLLDELYCSSTFLPSDSGEDPDQEKMKLLIMIYKLQDQLNRNNSLNGEVNARLSPGTYKGKHISSYYSHDLKEERFHHAFDYPKYDGGCSHGVNWCQRHKLLLKLCSAAATSSTHHADLSCFHCFPQEWQCPAELPPHVCQHEGLCRCHPGHNCCSSHRSHPLNPQWVMNSRPPLYGCETKSDDLSNRAYEVKRYPKEKQNLVNRHVRPVAGGAPFVTCHNCFELLHLPADFLLFKRVCHKLICGSCSEVLKFSLMNGSHIVSFAPSELNDESKVVNGSNGPSECHTNHYNSLQADPVSYSDDYGLSASKSYSSEDPVSLTAFHSLHGCEYDHTVSRETSEAITEQEKIASTHSAPVIIPVETKESAGRVTNIFVSGKVSQMEARPVPPARSSPLHQLMGYRSPSHVIRGTQSSGEPSKGIMSGRGSGAKHET